MITATTGPFAAPNIDINKAVAIVVLVTTHTPVPAGHDSFEESLVRMYMSHYPDRLKITWKQFIRLGKSNPEDKNAIEEALRIKENHDPVEVTALSMGPPQAEDALREALVMGVDRGILLSDRAFAGADTLATSYMLSIG
jgi:hypothetical protein